MKHLNCNLSDAEKYLIVKSLSGAIGDDVKACLRRENLGEQNSNGKKFLKWDMINRNLIANLDGSELTAEYAKRGSWNMVPLFHKKAGTIFTIMREDRFSTLRKEQPKRRKAHYHDAMAQSFNVDLEQNQQISLFGKKQYDEIEVKAVVESILRDFHIDSTIVQRYAIILYEEYHSEITSVRCCVVDSSLQIVDEEDWSEFIHYKESVVVDVVETHAEEREMPQMRLTDKARRRMGQKALATLKEEKETQDEQVI